MTVNIPTHFVSQFSTDVELLLQERGSKLRNLVRTGTHEGKQASPVNQFGAIEAQSPAGRFAPKNRTDAPTARRWVFPQDKEVDQLLDNFDMLRLIEDPKPIYAENAANAIGRVMDDAIIDSALGTSNVGETGTGSESFDTSNFSVANNFGAAGAVGLTVAKMIEVQKIFLAANVDLDRDPLTYIIAPFQHANLLNQIEVVSSDFNLKPVLGTDGMVRSFLGANIIISNRLDLTSTDRQIIAFVKSGMYLGLWKDITSRVSIRNDLSSEPWDIYSCATFGATRLEQGKVIRVLCSEA